MISIRFYLSKKKFTFNCHFNSHILLSKMGIFVSEATNLTLKLEFSLLHNKKWELKENFF